jgi:hypothetical protein
MTHVTFETAKRLKEAGLPQPKKTEKGQYWFANGELILFAGCEQVEVRMFEHDMVFAPTATDIMRHLPGWALYYHEGVWCCALVEDEFVIAEFRSDNPAEAAAEAFLLEQSHAKK